MHPPVLADRGLDAALSGLAALSPVPEVEPPGLHDPDALIAFVEQGERTLHVGELLLDRVQQ